MGTSYALTKSMQAGINRMVGLLAWYSYQAVGLPWPKGNCDSVLYPLRGILVDKFPRMVKGLCMGKKNVNNKGKPVPRTYFGKLMIEGDEEGMAAYRQYLLEHKRKLRRLKQEQHDYMYPPEADYEDEDD